MLQNSVIKESTQKYQQRQGDLSEEEKFLMTDDGTYLATNPMANPTPGMMTTGEYFTMTDSQGTQQHKKVHSPVRVYEVGKFKEYRRLVGLEQVKSHIGNKEQNMSLKKKKITYMKQEPPTAELTLTKPKRGGQVNDAIKEIMFNLEKFDNQRFQRNKREGVMTTHDDAKSYLLQDISGISPSLNSTTTRHNRNFEVKRQTQNSVSNQGKTSYSLPRQAGFLPKVEKQKVLDKFIDLSTADIYSNYTANPNSTFHYNNYRQPRTNNNSVAVQNMNQTVDTKADTKIRFSVGHGRNLEEPNGSGSVDAL